MSDRQSAIFYFHLAAIYGVLSHIQFGGTAGDVLLVMGFLCFVIALFLDYYKP